MTRPRASSRILLGGCSESFPNAQPVMRSNSRNVQARMCRHGVGIAVLPKVVGKQIPGLRQLKVPTKPPGRDIWIGYHRDLKHLHVCVLLSPR